MVADGLCKSGVLANDSLVPKRIDYEALALMAGESRKHGPESPASVDS